MLKRFASLTAILFVFAGIFPLAAKAQLTTGTLRGFVADLQGEPLPGVTIELESEALMRPRSATTDAKGYYRFLYLPPGTYTICAKLQGFGTCWQKGVPVLVGQTSSADIKMEMEGLEETIEVTASAPLIDKVSSAISYNVNLEMIQTVPLAPRMDFASTWFLLPGVIDSGGGRAQVNPSMIARTQGASFFWDQHFQDDSHENKVVIDGMEINDSMSGNTFSTLNFDAVEEIDVKTSGASAEYGNSRNSFMNIVTKSGGNAFHGSFLFRYQPMSFVSTNVKGATPNKIRYMIPSLTLSGPIVKDKLWFLASYQYNTEDYQFPDTIVVDKLVQKSRAPMPFIKLSFQPHKNHTLTLVYANDAMEIKPTAFPDSKRSTIEAGNRQNKNGPMYSGTWRWILNDSLYFNFVAGYYRKPQDTYALTSLPRIRYTNIYRGVTQKYDQGYGEDYWSVRENVTVSGHLTWSVDDLWQTGSHELKFGVDLRPYQHVTRTRKYWKDQYGYYQYSYGLDYETYGLSAPYIWEAIEVFPGNQYDNEVLVTNQNVFLQDLWTVNKNLTIQLGIRWEHQQEYMYGRDELPVWMEAIYPKIRENVEFNDSGFAPRLGFTYNLEKVGVFKLHFGRYFEAVGTGDYNNYSRVIAFSTWRMDPADFGQGPEALKIYSQGQLAYGADYNDIDNMKAEYNDEITASFEREIAWDFAFSTSFVYRKLYSTSQEDVNAVFEDGKFVGRKFPDFDTIWMRTMYSGDARRAYFDFKGLQFQLKRNFAETWGFLINYSRSWNSYHRTKFDPGSTDQFVYANPSDISMINYGPRWAFHASFFYRLPWGFLASAYVSGQDGFFFADKTGDYAWNDTAPTLLLSNGRKVTDILWQARNSYWVGKKFGASGRRTDSLWNFNVRVQKSVAVGKFRLDLSLDVFNVFNSAVYQSWGSFDIRHPRYEEKTNPQTPRSMQLNFKVEF
jgi:hypothetical protein